MRKSSEEWEGFVSHGGGRGGIVISVSPGSVRHPVGLGSNTLSLVKTPDALYSFVSQC